MKTADSVPAKCLKSCDPPHTIGQPVDAVTLKYVHRVTDAAVYFINIKRMAETQHIKGVNVMLIYIRVSVVLS